ncbi:hypothetical protein B0H10DRAFT_2247457 [Mycena sp. CBHHK59/15]|nr:hypothetical protein B0H10DRAFT_2247457 [Mycena sp. CBHHK59/15]
MPSTILHPRHVTAHSRTSPLTSMSCHVTEFEFPDHSLSPLVEQRCSVPIRPELARDPVHKPRSRRCFVCGTTGMHPLDFRVCPRTAVLLRRSLARINEHGRLVAFDGSPLPMTRHPGGVAAHLLSRFRNPASIVSEPRESPPVPRIAHVPPHPVPTDIRAAPPPPAFHSSSPHAILPVVRAAPAPEYIPLRCVAPPFDHTHRSPSDVESRARASWLLVFLESLLDGVFRAQLRVIVSAIERLGVQDSSTLRQHLQPVFERISLPLL